MLHNLSYDIDDRNCYSGGVLLGRWSEFAESLQRCLPHGHDDHDILRLGRAGAARACGCGTQLNAISPMRNFEFAPTLHHERVRL